MVLAIHLVLVIFKIDRVFLVVVLEFLEESGVVLKSPNQIPLSIIIKRLYIWFLGGIGYLNQEGIKVLVTICSVVSGRHPKNVK